MAPGLLSFLRSVYDLDTIDTRLTTPSSVPYSAKSAAAADDDGRNKKDDKRSASPQAVQTSPSRWLTPEFLLYYFLLSFIIPYMFWIAYSVSRRMLGSLCSTFHTAVANTHCLLHSLGS